MNTVQFLFDYASPWSYLANATLEKKFAGAQIEYVPVYLRGLEMFATAMPYSARKLQYIMKDLVRCAAHEQVPVRIPDEFPINGLYALRGALYALETGTFSTYNERLFAATWADNKPISNKEVVIALAGEAGLDRAIFREAIERPDIKAKLKDTTAAYQERGVFGVPTFFVGDEFFWGHDRMEYVQRAVRAGAALPH